jgi:hypothetical protein
LHGVLSAVPELQIKPEGLGGRLKEIVRGSRTADEVAGYERKIRELRSNFLVRVPWPLASHDPDISAHRNYGYKFSRAQGFDGHVAR